jgi:hypothetical protein
MNVVTRGLADLVVAEVLEQRSAEAHPVGHLIGLPVDHRDPVQSDTEDLRADLGHDRLAALAHRRLSGAVLDEIVAIARTSPGCLGARMTGGGFAGCAVALVRTDRPRNSARSSNRDTAVQAAWTPPSGYASPSGGSVQKR